MGGGGFIRNGSSHMIPPLLQPPPKDGMFPDSVASLTFGSLNAPNSTVTKLQPTHSPTTSAVGRSSKGPHTRSHDKGAGISPAAASSAVGHSQRLKGLERWVSANGRQDGERNLEKQDEMPVNQPPRKLPLGVQLDKPGPLMGSNRRSVPAADIEESLKNLHGEVAADRRRSQTQMVDRTSSPDVEDVERDALSEQLVSFLMVGDGESSKNGTMRSNGPPSKDLRPDRPRGQLVSVQRIRHRRKEIACRSDIDRFTPYFLKIYESLIPLEEEKAKQEQLRASLEKLVNNEWPNAQLRIYGSCANSFGVSNSDIDVCLAINDDDISKPEMLLKLAEILESNNLQNVQALTRARVPIVKLMDPVTKLSCDICINNVLALTNTKLLRDYAQIDVRLRQMAFIVKHWAKLRGVNETYQGTLSSYAYVLMCIHFLQLRKPAILPCLQEMEATYEEKVGDVQCAYFDRVECLIDFGAQNKESIAYLLWAFFDYWAYRHDYANAVISVRTGAIISKRFKDWTRRVGNDRHLICIEDPFEINHDLGRVVDKYSIKTLREEFERAADILQYDPNPNVTLFEPYVPS